MDVIWLLMLFTYVKSIKDHTLKKYQSITSSLIQTIVHVYECVYSCTCRCRDVHKIKPGGSMGSWKATSYEYLEL